MSKRLGIIILVVLVIGVGLGIYLIRQNQDNREHASENSTVTSENIVAVVGKTPITKDMVKTAALEQYAESAITSEVEKSMLNVLIERTILDQEAAKNNITVTQEEMDKTTSGGQSARYEVLKNKIKSSLIQSVQAYTIGYWVPPTDYAAPLTDEQKTTIDNVRRDGTKALSEAEISLGQNQDALTVAQALIKKYPSLVTSIGVNGYILSKTQDASLMTTPHIYTNDPQNKGQPFFDTLFSMKEGEIKTALNPKDAGGSVIKVVKVTTSKYPDYDAFLKAKITELVTVK